MRLLERTQSDAPGTLLRVTHPQFSRTVGSGLCTGHHFAFLIQSCLRPCSSPLSPGTSSAQTKAQGRQRPQGQPSNTGTRAPASCPPQHGPGRPGRPLRGRWNPAAHSSPMAALTPLGLVLPLPLFLLPGIISHVAHLHPGPCFWRSPK